MARFALPSLGIACTGPAMLHLCLQLLVCLSLAVRLLALARHLRHAWRGTPIPDAAGRRLAADFRGELRRRGLLSAPPLAQPD
jgi:hypothetical protein